MTTPAPLPGELLPALGPHLDGKRVVITGGTDGIGAELALLLRGRGADVVIIGRSAAKGRALVERASAMPGTGSLVARSADFSLMRSVEETVDALAEDIDHIDVLVHAVGTFISHTEHTAEGIELDFAVSYLARFVFLERAAERGLLGAGTRVISLAATNTSTPRFARVEFDDVAAVTARTGLRGHTAAQTANDLLMAVAPTRYGVASMGYGPGNVRTGILRAQPRWLRLLIGIFPKREPQAVAQQLAELLIDDQWSATHAGWAGKRGRIAIAPFMADETRQRALVAASEELHQQAIASPLAQD